MRKENKIIQFLVQDLFFLFDVAEDNFFEIGQKIYHALKAAICWLLPSNGDRSWNTEVTRLRSGKLDAIIRGFITEYEADCKKVEE